MSEPSGLRSLLQELAERAWHDPEDAVVRLAVRVRARDACEYCLLPTTIQFQIDHVIPPRLWDAYIAGQLHAMPPSPAHRGPDHLDNFAWSCATCNRTKGQQVSFRIGRLTHRLFDPRRDRWQDHFVFFHTYLLIAGLPGIGRATEQALRLNDPRLGGPLGTRHDAIMARRYPPRWAQPWLVGSEP